jgi:hypothetical protein
MAAAGVVGEAAIPQKGKDVKRKEADLPALRFTSLRYTS